MSNNNIQMELDLKDIMWRLLSQWKAVLLFSVALGLLFCAIKYSSDIKDYKAQLIEQAEAEEQMSIPADERISTILKELPTNQRRDVEYIVNEQDWVDTQKAYMSGSILMRTDPTNQRLLSLVYDIDAENEENLPVLVQAYLAYAGSDDSIKAIKEMLAPKTDSKYIGELYYDDNNAELNIIEGNSAVLVIRIILPEESDSNAITKAISEALLKYKTLLQTEYPHSIKLAASDITHIYNNEIARSRKDMFESIYDIEKSIKEGQSNLTETQKTAINKIITINREKYRTESDESNGAEFTQGNSLETIDPPEYNKKYAILGFILGVVIYATAYTILLLLRGCINSAKDVERYTSLRLLGEVYKVSGQKGIKRLFHSNLVDKLRYREKNNSFVQKEKAVETIESVCQRESVETLTIFGLTEQVSDIIEVIENKGIAVDGNTVTDSTNEKELLNVKNALLAVGTDTKLSFLNKAISVCKDYGINILGCVFITEK